MNSAESRIKSALNDAVGHKNSGLPPTEAVSKAASGIGLNPDETERLVESFNIALTNATIHAAEDKTASFPLADRGQVMANVFDVFKSASSEKVASADQVEAFSVEAGRIDLSWMHGGMPKSASLDNPDELVRHSHNAFQKIGQALEASAQEAYDAGIGVERRFEAMIDHMEESAFSGKFATLEMQALSEYGEGIKPVLDNLFDAVGLAERGERRFEGTAKIGSTYFSPTTEYRLFEDLMSVTESLHEKNAALEKVAEEAGREVSEITALLNEAVPETAPRSSPKTAYAADLISGKGDSGGGIKGIDIQGLVGDPPFDRGSGLLPSTWQGVAGTISDTFSKAHGDALKKFYSGPKDDVGMEKDNIDRATILSDLIANDEIISRADRRDVEDSYSALLQIAPSLTKNRAVVKGWLRQASASQAVDPFMTKQLLDLEKGHLTNKALEKGERPLPS